MINPEKSQSATARKIIEYNQMPRTVHCNCNIYIYTHKYTKVVRVYHVHYGWRRKDTANHIKVMKAPPQRRWIPKMSVVRMRCVLRLATIVASVQLCSLSLNSNRLELKQSRKRIRIRLSSLYFSVIFIFIVLCSVQFLSAFISQFVLSRFFVTLFSLFANIKASL